MGVDRIKPQQKPVLGFTLLIDNGTLIIQGYQHKINHCIVKDRIIQSKELFMATEQDIVLIYHEDKPLTFARIEEILPDHKPDWYHVRLLILQVPVHTVTWILRDVYINGETFTMGGKSMRLERVEPPKIDLFESDPKPTPDAVTDTNDDTRAVSENGQDKATVISFKDLKRNNGK